MRTRQLTAQAAAVMIALTGGCIGERRQSSRPARAAAPAPKRPVTESPELPKVRLRAFIYIDDDFVRRFGDAKVGGRQKLNDWLWRVEYYIQHGRFFQEERPPVSIYIAGIDHWHLPNGALDGKAIFKKYVPKEAPQGSGANCMIALTGREGVYWSGIAKWPRIFTKAQAAEPIDDKTVSVLCHEISHWFGAKDIIDAGFAERSVMNYLDERFGFVNGRIVWDSANRDRMKKAMADWRRH